MNTYEQWTRNEIERLRSDAQKASADADTLQRTLDKWLASQDRPTVSGVQEDGEPKQMKAPKRRMRKTTHGSKNDEAISRIKAASPDGLPMEALHEAFTEKFGADYKRSSLRALLWNLKERGTIENRNGRYVIAANGQDT
jgi:hypothetical protein